MTGLENGFNFRAHEQMAATAYLKHHGSYEDLASIVKRVLEEALKRRGIKVHSVQARAKEPASFGKKAVQPSEVDPTQPKYPHPLEQITDLAGIRIITYFPSTLDEIDRMLADEFRIVERSDKGAELIEDDRFGYQSIRYLVKFTSLRSRLPEYEPFVDAIAEIQVRTILQHAWAEIEHDIQYKSASAIPVEIRRRFMALAGMLELADREFQAIQNADKQLTAEARSRVAGGQLSQVEITPDAIKAFLDKKLGSDGRMSEFSYDWTARLLKQLGFRTLEQVEKCISGYDDDRLSRIAIGSRLGQTARFEYMLLAGVGEHYLRRHTFAGEPWHERRVQEELQRFQKAGADLRDYDPLTDQSDTSPRSDRTAGPEGNTAVAEGAPEG